MSYVIPTLLRDPTRACSVRYTRGPGDGDGVECGCGVGVCVDGMPTHASLGTKESTITRAVVISPHPTTGPSYKGCGTKTVVQPPVSPTPRHKAAIASRRRAAHPERVTGFVGISISLPSFTRMPQIGWLSLARSVQPWSGYCLPRGVGSGLARGGVRVWAACNKFCPQGAVSLLIRSNLAAYSVGYNVAVVLVVGSDRERCLPWFLKSRRCFAERFLL